jgi:hypothetical protein
VSGRSLRLVVRYSDFSLAIQGRVGVALSVYLAEGNSGVAAREVPHPLSLGLAASTA